MSKYCFELKLKIVKEYLESVLGYQLLAKKYGIPSSTPIQKWVRAFKAFGEDGLRCKHSKKVYSVHFKLDVLHFMKQTGASYQETAIAFHMNEPSMIANWNYNFLKKGLDGLKPKPKGRPSMPKNRKVKPVKHVKHEEISSREKQLERENELLRLEIAYLKKLNAFQENPNAFLEKHKQRWHSNSKKMDSN